MAKKLQICALAVLMTWSCGWGACAAAVELPDIGEAGGATISREQDRRLGEAFMRNVRRSLKIIDDAEINEYIQSLGYQIVAQSDSQSLDFTFFVVDAPSVNAFAGPGGYIGIHSGLFLITETESELVSVIAHEIAHVTQRHLARTFETASKLSVPTMAAVIAAIILGANNNQLGQAALAATAAGSIQTQLNFTRAHEQEADRVGIQTMASAGFDPRSMPLFFERLHQSARFYENGAPEFLRTHPVTLSRIADSRNRAEQYRVQDREEQALYHLMRAKLRSMTAEDPNQAIKLFNSQLSGNEGIAREAAQYGLALSLSRAGQHEDAWKLINVLITKDPERLSYIVAICKIELAATKSKACMMRLEAAVKLFPHNHALTMLYARALLNNGQSESAKELLQDHARRKQPGPALYQLLARAQGEAGYSGQAHQSLAELAYLNGDTHAAIDHLKTALRLTPEEDILRISSIKARIKQLTEEALMEANLPQ